MSSLTVRDYHIGWIYALKKEMAAAIAMLDKEYPMITAQDYQDHNSYVLGRIHQHNVVIACMPAGIDGLVPAAVVAKDLARTFPELRIGLMVGIGGGIPDLANSVEIRLGDVVVSMPDKTWGGVVQYDHGKAESGDVFTRKGQLNQPPESLLQHSHRCKRVTKCNLTRLISISLKLWSEIPCWRREDMCDPTNLTSYGVPAVTRASTAQPAVVVDGINDGRCVKHQHQ
jgi:nucleoside phosphorylase